MLRTVVQALDVLDHERATPATRVAGAVRLARRVQQLVSAGR